MDEAVAGSLLRRQFLSPSQNEFMMDDMSGDAKKTTSFGRHFQRTKRVPGASVAPPRLNGSHSSKPN
ncbi:hypothetical protein EJB05_12387 [Eragrostis curvula]|uniref:Uncharacterized protein n=1 Tax=Eragrostis curvula TaxID=38414 RepID=A0A5J9VS62_9POAL|nr:hypothetical protein EJB05_12387 [Eragrostis curvula]